MDCESPSEDEDVEAKMYAMIHFVDSENPYSENDAISTPLGENTNSNCHFLKEHGISSSNNEIQHIVPISKLNDEPNKNQNTSEGLLLNSKLKNNNRCGTEDSNYTRTVSMQKVSSKDVNKPEFLVTISIKNNENSQLSINEAIQESVSTNIPENVAVTNKQSVRLCDSEIFTKKILTPQIPEKINTPSIACIDGIDQNECSILIRDVRPKSIATKSNRQKTKSSPVKPVKKSAKLKDNNRSSTSTNIQIIDLDSSSGNESDVEVIPESLIPVSAIYIESSDDESVVNKSSGTITAEVKCSNVSVEPDKINTSDVTPRQSIKSSDKTTCVSPVPSVTSSVSDEFILADCSNLNITSNEPSNLKFNFELHGADLCDNAVKETPKKRSNTPGKTQKQSNKSSNKITCVSPVPSVMSSMSDEFIIADCCNLNITSSKNEQSSLKFNFDLHGADLCDNVAQETPKKRSKKKSLSEIDTAGADLAKKIDSLDVAKIFELKDVDSSVTVVEETPKKRSKKKSLSEIDTVNTDLAKKLDSQNIAKKLLSTNSDADIPVSPDRKDDTFATPKCNSKKKNQTPKSISYTVNNIEYVTPSIDVYESESSDFPESVVDVPVTFTPKRKKKTISSELKEVDSLVMANVVGINNSSNIDSKTYDMKDTSSAKGSKKKRNRNKSSQSHSDDQDCVVIFDSGADFDHIKLQREMPNGKEYWPIDLADKLREKKYKRSQVICGFCSKVGHRDDNCYSKPKKCAMCGIEGHKELRCPNKICLNCGNRNDMFTSDCGICVKWRKVFCVICKGYGHPSDHCPDIWRRYHRTISFESPLTEEKSRKNTSQLFCSGCTGRGHLINTCKEYISFTEFKIPSPYIFEYTPVYGESVKNRTVNQNDSEYHQMTMKRKGDKECSASHSKRLSDSTSSTQEKTSSHILLRADTLNRLNSQEGQDFLIAASAKFSLIIKQSKTDMGDILMLTGNVGEQEEFQFDFRQWMDVKEPTVEITTKCRLPKNKIAAVNYITTNINSLSANLGDPQTIHRNLQSFEKKYRKMIGCHNKLINAKKMQSICSKINNARQVLNKILIGQAGYDDGHANIKKLQTILAQLKYSDSMVVNNHMRNQITAHFSPIFSEAPRDDYPKLISLYYSKVILTSPSPKSQKKNKFTGGDVNYNKNKVLLDRIHMTRRKLQDSYRRTGVDPYGKVDPTWKLLDMCEYQIQNNQTSKDTFFNLRKATSRVDKYILETQRFV